MSFFKRKLTRSVVLFLSVFLLNVTNVRAQTEDDGPAPPPPAAPIDGWIPVFILGAIGVGCFYEIKKISGSKSKK